ncbi:MAG: TatD family hydrolase [Planctomycetota bacterium]
MLIDSHSHLNFPEAFPDLAAVKRSMDQAGVEAAVVVGTGIDSSRRASALSCAWMFPTAGIHPNETSFDDSPAQWRELESLAADAACVAVGETGLDGHHKDVPFETQKIRFKKQMGLARDRGLPLIVHSREAGEETRAMLRAEGRGLSGVLHCFDGHEALAREALDMGWYISLAGNITFKNAQPLQDCVRRLPGDRFLVETDAPFLSPHPHRGKPNDPSLMVHTASKLAELRGLSTGDITRITRRNTINLFRLPLALEGVSLVYPIRDSLYINLTRRCSARCTFCPREDNPVVKGHDLGLTRDTEPGADDVIRAMGDLGQWKEVVFCGFGEPTLRLEELKIVARHAKKAGKRVRLNTNGHGSLIHRRNIVPELVGLVDCASISLDAPDPASYMEIVRPAHREKAFPGLLEFARECRRLLPEAVLSVVTVPGLDLEACRALAAREGLPLRERPYNEVG